MIEQKFEVYGSLKQGVNGTEAYLSSGKAITVTFPQLIEALCMYKHKQGLKEDQCIGYKITSSEIILLFEK
jgi:hypothetical protein